MTKAERSRHDRAQKRIADKYRALGYDVLEQPEPERLPPFMQGAAPDIVARSEGDNVVIEVKQGSSLKGSNTTVALADRVSGRPDWRFELVVLNGDDAAAGRPEATLHQVMERARQASRIELRDVAYVYLGTVLADVAEEVAAKAGMKPRGKSERDLIHDLGFRGLLPDSVVQASLAALARRNQVVHDPDTAAISESDVGELLRLCERVAELAA